MLSIWTSLKICSFAKKLENDFMISERFTKKNDGKIQIRQICGFGNIKCLFAIFLLMESVYLLSLSQTTNFRLFQTERVCR